MKNIKFLEDSIKAARRHAQNGAIGDDTRAALRKHENELKAQLKAAKAENKR
jgi:hypothetical protein